MAPPLHGHAPVAKHGVDYGSSLSKATTYKEYEKATRKLMGEHSAEPADTSSSKHTVHWSFTTRVPALKLSDKTPHASVPHAPAYKVQHAAERWWMPEPPETGNPRIDAWNRQTHEMFSEKEIENRINRYALEHSDDPSVPFYQYGPDPHLGPNYGPGPGYDRKLGPEFPSSPGEETPDWVPGYRHMMQWPI